MMRLAVLGCAVLLGVLWGVEITVEAESLAGKSAIRKRSGFSGGAFSGKWTELTGSAEIPVAGLWYVWVRYSTDWKRWESKFGTAGARKLRSFRLIVGDNSELFEAIDGSPWSWGCRRMALPKGKILLKLQAVGGDPYVDVIVFTRDPEFVPKRDFTKTQDVIDGAAVIPRARRSIAVPRGENFAETQDFVIRGGGKSRKKTSAFLRHDGRTLFVRIRCEQDKSTLQTRGGAMWHQDGVEFVLDGNRSLSGLRHVIVSPDNKIYAEKDGSAWQCPWSRKVEVRDNAWSVELAVPLADLLDTLPRTPGRMRANFCRRIQACGENSSWVPFGRGFSDPTTCGELVFQGMSDAAWNAVYLASLNEKASALGEAPLAAGASAGEILKFERKLDDVLRRRFAPPPGMKFVFEGTNLLPNPGFEYGQVRGGAVAPFNWNARGTGRAAIARGGYRGKHALRIDGAGKDFRLTPETKPYIDSTLEYEWSGFFKTDTPGSKLTLKVIWYALDLEAASGWGAIRKSGESTLVVEPGGKWRRAAMKIRPPRGTVNCGFEIACSGQAWCDEFCFDGMGTADVEFLLPQPGFDADASKKVVIWSKRPLSGPVELYSGNRLVSSVSPVKYGRSRWKGDAFFADFSTVTAPGTYHLVCRAGELTVKSHEFTVEKELYMRLAKFASRFYFIQRQGVDVPGWHKANFLDDAVVVDRKTGKVSGHRDVSGGWQDAGDPSKQAPADLSIFGLSEFFENTGCAEYGLKEKYPDIFALAWPEVDRQISKCYAGNGLFMGIAVNNINGVHYRIRNADVGERRTRPIHGLPPEKWTDNIPGTWDDRYISGPPGLQWMVSGLTKFALSVRRYDPAVAEKIARIVSEDYPVRQARQRLWEKRPLERIARGDGELAKIASHLYLLTAKEQYRTDLENYIGEIVKVYEAGLYRSEKKSLLNSCEERYNFFNQSMTLFDYLRYFPQGRHRAAAEKALKGFVEYIFKRSHDNEFGIVTHIYTGPGFRLSAPAWYNEENGSNRRIARLGYLAARAARVFGEPRYLPYADCAAQFILGRNPKNMSMLIGNGWKFAATATTLRFCEGHGDGVIPGAVIRGMTAMPDSPPDFPALNASSDPGGCAKGTMHEVWQEDTNAFILLCQELAMARREAIVKK